MADADQLVQSFKVAVHNLQVLNASRGQEPVTERDPSVLEVLFVLERILHCDLQHVKLILATTPWDFLEKVSDCIPNGSKIKKHIRGLSSSGIGRARVFLRFGFNNGCLDEYLKALLWNQRLTRTYYGADSVLLNEDRANVFLSLLDLLKGVSFKLALKEPNLEVANYWDSYLRRKAEERKRIERRQSQQALSPGGAGQQGRAGEPDSPLTTANPSEADAALKEAQEANVSLRVELEKAHLANSALEERERKAKESVKEMEKIVQIYRQYMAEIIPNVTLDQMQRELQQAQANGEDEGGMGDQDWDEALTALGAILEKGSSAMAEIKAADSKAHARISHAGKRGRTRSTMRQETASQGENSTLAVESR